MNQEDLTALYTKLGARDPELWASTQLTEGIKQLARFVFLREAWKNIIDDGDPSWIENELQWARDDPNAAYSGIGLAVESLRSRGATDEEMTDLVRGLQVKMLFEICYLLDGPQVYDFPELNDMVYWSLFVVDGDGLPVAPLGGLYENIAETDPTGREMRPRGVLPPE